MTTSISAGRLYFAWKHRDLGDHVVYPDVLDKVSRTVEEGANSLKQTREVREERFLARRRETEGT